MLLKRLFSPAKKVDILRKLDYMGFMKNHLGLILISLFFFAACGGPSSPPEPELSTEERLALPANIVNGERLFRTCAVCHDKAKEGAHRVGPKMWGVYGQAAAVHKDFSYSAAMRRSDVIWDDASLDAYIRAPREIVPGTRMAFDGEPDPANRRDIVAFLKTLQD